MVYIVGNELYLFHREVDSVSDLGSVRVMDDSKLLQLAIDKIVDFLVSNVSVHSRSFLVRAAEAPRNNANLLPRLLDHQSTSTVSAARILSPFGHASADHTRCYFDLVSIDLCALFPVHYVDLNGPEEFPISAFLNSN